MEVKRINKFYKKLFLLIVLVLFTYLFLKFKFNNQKILNNDFTELNNIELYVDSDSNYIINFLDQFNLNDINIGNKRMHHLKRIGAKFIFLHSKP